MAAAASAGGSGAGAKAPNPMTASLGSGTASVNISSFGFLMFAVAKYFDSRKGGPTTMQAKLHAFGKPIGQRAIELVCRRHKRGVRFTTLKEAGEFVRTRCWTELFGATVPMDTIAEGEQYYIADSNPLCNRFIPTTKSLAGIMAGIAEGMFAGLGFPVTVTAARSGTVGETVFVVKMPE